MPTWGELLRNGDAQDAVPLSKAIISIGRSSKADVQIVHNQVSGTHCQLIYNEVTHKVVVCDKSSNGTLLRSAKSVVKKLPKNVETELNDKDCIVVVKTATAEKQEEQFFEFRRRCPAPSNVSPISMNTIETAVEPVKQMPQTEVEPQPLNETQPQPFAESVKSITNLPVKSENQLDSCQSHMSARENLVHDMSNEASNDSFNESDLPDFDQCLATNYIAEVPALKTSETVSVKPAIAIKVVPAKRPANFVASSLGPTNSKSELNLSPSSGPSAAKKPAAKSSSSSNQAPLPVVTTSSVIPSINLDDSDELPDFIDDFKAPPSVAELRARPPPVIVPPNASAAAGTTKQTTSTMTAAERAQLAQRKLMAELAPHVVAQPAAAPPVPQAPSSENDVDAELESNLTCTICQEIFHEPVTIVPCQHCFCAGCLSMWLEKSKDCPQCRGRLQQANPIHLVKSSAEAFLAKHPNRKRTAEEIADLDKHDTIVKNKKLDSATQKKGGRGGGFAAAYDSGSDYSDDDSYDADGGNFGFFNAGPLAMMMQMFGYNGNRGSRGGTTARGRGRGARGGLASSGPSTTAPTPILCRQCPGGDLATQPQASVRGGGRGGRGRGRGRGGAPLTSSASNAVAGTSSVTAPTLAAPTSIPPYTCAPNAAHMTCKCCSQRFPSREGHLGVPPFRCQLCQGTYCHMYWGCRGPGCAGCLGVLGAFNPAPHELEGGIAMLTNTSESGFFADYLHKKNVLPRTVIETSYQLMDIHGMPELPGINRQSVVCRICFKNKVIPAVAYAYRAQLTSADLPPTVANRPNCEWGRECRTQKRSVAHARKFNHICQPGLQGASSSSR